MAAENSGSVLRGIGRIFDGGSLTGLDEGQLVRHFAAGDEAAFDALIARHGPMVRGVCRRSLGDPRDVEDAFQATFLVLLRKAGGLRDPEAIGPWLYGVAYRVSARIRARAVRRPARERRAAPEPGRAAGRQPGTGRAAEDARRGDRPTAGEVSPAGGAVLRGGPDARGGGASAEVHGGERPGPAGPGASEAPGAAGAPRAWRRPSGWRDWRASARRPRSRCRRRWRRRRPPRSRAPRRPRRSRGRPGRRRRHRRSSSPTACSGRWSRRSCGWRRRSWPPGRSSWPSARHG